jgi:SAM-dependent methyltransferase
VKFTEVVMTRLANHRQAEAWNGTEGRQWAANADRYDAMAAGINEPLLTAARIGSRQRVLDIGCGTGSLTRLTGRLAVHGQVLGVDISAPMLARARAATAAEGLTNVRFEQGDAQVHPLPVGAFDVAVSRGGVMFFDDHAAAFANIGQSLRPGGRLVFAGPGPAGSAPEHTRAFAALAPLMRRPSPASRGMGALTDPARIEAILTDAGFIDISVTGVAVPCQWGQNADDATDFYFTMGPVAFNLADADAATVERARAGVRAALREFETPAGVSVQGSIWLVTAGRPSD